MPQFGTDRSSGPKGQGETTQGIALGIYESREDQPERVRQNFHKNISGLHNLGDNRQTLIELCELVMAQSLAKILVHLVFSTKYRQPTLPAEPYEPLRQYSYGICQEQKCHLIEMNNVSDHVHVLLDLHRTETLADLVMHLKKGTSRWLKEQSREFRDFDWQDGYGAFSLGMSQRQSASAHIRGQQAHHAIVSFQDEFLAFLHRYKIQFDERYVWS